MFIRNLLLIPKEDEVIVDAGGSTSNNQPPPPDANVSFIDDGDSTTIDLEPEKTQPVQRQSQQPSFNPPPSHQAPDPNLVNILADIRNRLNNNSNPRTDSDEFNNELDQLAERERALGVQWEVLKGQNKLDKPTLDDFERKSRQIQDRKAEITAQRALNKVLPQILNAQQRNHYQMTYADVNSNPRASQYARGRYEIMLAEGAADGPELIDRAMNEARVKFGMAGAKPVPTNNDRQQLSGVSGGGGRVKQDNQVKLGKAEKSMAMEMYGPRFNGDEKKAYAAWAKGPGLRAKRAEEKIRARGGW